MASFLPWQLDDANRLLADPTHLPHALLIHGIPGIGKRDFVQAMAATLLCENRQGAMACGQCQGCVWMRAGTHPDFKLVRPEAVAVREGAAMVEDETVSTANATSTTNTPQGSGATKRKPSEEFRIEQIRALESWYHQATHRGGWRIVVLYPAQALSVVSANALLKALEEPPANTLFLLATDAPERLLPTIVSRCQKFALALAPSSQLADWLEQQGVKQPHEWLAAAGGAPLAALELAQTGQSPCPAWVTGLIADLSKGQWIDLPAMADQLAKGPATPWLHALQQLVVDLGLSAAGLPVRYFPALAGAYQPLAQRKKLRAMSEFSGWINQQMRLANHPLSAKLFAQTCLQRFCDALK